ncbi:MAG: 30S ribosomal protein S3ae [Candidatus Aenigmarchaeota archaeon]|nr:30S ribosomal protein S3ae [Candidatus Aenigmarchaeota archaeon]
MVKKAKAKQWFTIIAPDYLENKEIGKTLAEEPNPLIGRRITVNLVELTNDLSKYYMKFTFKIKKVEGEKAFADFDGSECLRDYISRMVLRKIRRIDTIQDLTTSDGVKIRVKGLAIVSRKINSKTKKFMRKRISEIIKEEVEKSKISEFVKKIIDNTIKNRVMQEARKIYPIRNFEIRKTEVLS